VVGQSLHNLLSFEGQTECHHEPRYITAKIFGKTFTRFKGGKNRVLEYLNSDFDEI